MLNWSVNLTMLFKENPFLERFQAAAAAGFQAVEFMWPTGVELSVIPLASQDAGVDVVLFNVDSGDVPGGDRGFPNDPDKKDWWRSRAEAAVRLAGDLHCPRLNVQAGNMVIGRTRAEMQDCLCENLDWALTQAPDMTFLLEPLNHFEHPRYILGCTAAAREVIERIGNPRLQLQWDVYHTQRSEGNLTRQLEENISIIGHIQVADAPMRHQPGTGEINWRYLFQQVEQLDYAGYIGLEYNPVPDMTGSFDWIPREKRDTCTTADLVLS